MDRRAAKEKLHIRGWFEVVEEIIAPGKDAHLADVLLQEAGDSLMMKRGESASSWRLRSPIGTSRSIITTRSTAL